MKAFTINRLYICQLSGEAYVEYSWQANGEPQTETKHFSSLANAKAYLIKHAKDWFMVCLERYIHHKKHIIDLSPNVDQKKALETCQNALLAYETMELATIAKKFTGGIKFFRDILPGYSNPSRPGSEANLAELENFCKTQTPILCI